MDDDLEDIGNRVEKARKRLAVADGKYRERLRRG